MERLDHLTLNYNLITDLGKGYFRGLSALTTLYIDHNGIRTINKDAFEGLEENLASLQLTGNQVREESVHYRTDSSVRARHSSLVYTHSFA